MRHATNRYTRYSKYCVKKNDVYANKTAMIILCTHTP